MNCVNFRNLQDQNIKFSSKFNLFYGKNAQGKTSILETLYFCATGKSFRTTKNSELIQYGKEKTGCYLLYEDLISKKELSVKIDKKNKEYKYNGKKVPFDEFYGRLNVVTFIPEDVELIMGTPGIRRSFFDAEIAQTSYEYLKDLKDYTKLLKIRNKFIKEKKVELDIFQIYQEQFIKKAAKLLLKRVEYVKKISIILNLNYRKLFDNNKELSLKYESSLGDLNVKGLNLNIIEEKLRERLKVVKNQELKYGYTLIGPQKDDFKFLLNEKDAKAFSSQGEKKSIIFSLKLSEVDMVIKDRREPPIFIIDDISSYFDSIRKENIINYLKKREMQVFLSSTGELNIESKNFKVDRGEIQNETSECK